MGCIDPPRPSSEGFALHLRRRQEHHGRSHPEHPAAFHQHHPHPFHGRRAGGQQRPSGHAHGPGPGGLRALQRGPALRPRRSPLWPDRDRFVLSCGHASMLLYSVLHLGGVQAGRRPRPADRRAGRAAGRHPPLPPARQPLPGPSRARPHQRRGNHHRAAGPGHRQQRGHGHRLPLAGRPLQSARASTCSTSTSTPCAATAT